MGIDLISWSLHCFLCELRKDLLLLLQASLRNYLALSVIIQPGDNAQITPCSDEWRYSSSCIDIPSYTPEC